MKRILFFSLSLLFSLCLTYSSSAQGWDRVYDIDFDDYSSAVTTTTDGGYAFLGGIGQSCSFDCPNVIVARTDADGDTLWTTILPADSVKLGGDLVQTADQGFVFVGAQRGVSDGPGGAFIQKVSAEGQEVWRRTFNNLHSFSEANAVIQTPDGGFLLGGQNTGDILVIKTDAEGIEEWRETINIGAFEAATTLANTADGNYMIAGYTFENAVAIKMAPDGTVLWQQFAFFTDFEDIVETPDGDFLLSGFEQLTRISADGNTVTNVPINLDYESFGGGLLVASSPGTYAYLSWGSQIDTDIDRNVLLSIIDGSGNILQTEQITATLLPFFEEPIDVKRCTDGGFIVLTRRFAVSGNQDFHLIKTGPNGTVFSNEICGVAFQDTNDDCLFDDTEESVWAGWVVQATDNNQTLYAITDDNGNFCMQVDTGTYELTLYPPYTTWEACPPLTLNFDTPDQSANIEIGAAADYPCPLMTVSTTSFLFRGCMESWIDIQYCNEGGFEAEDAFVEVRLDPQIMVSDATLPFTNPEPDVYQLALGTIVPGDCGTIRIFVDIDCEAELDQTLCYETEIFPSENCYDEWMDGILEVEADCNDGTIEFRIQNIADFPMSEQTQYLVIEDNIILMSEQIDLDAGGILPVPITVENGSTYRLEVAQLPDFPGILGGPFASATVEGCDGFSPGFVNVFPPDDGEPYLDINCVTVTGSYDPNDKQAIPEGYGPEHNIRPNTDLTYKIRFQNTGTDTAFTVVIRDTISEFLDLTTIKAGASSHPYRLDIVDGRTLKFTFDNILLPDSTTNEPASQGYVQYEIAQKRDLDLGTVINNSAAIYFDFNPPIITNETMHTIAENFILVDILEIDRPDLQMTVAPNPATDYCRIDIQGLDIARGTLRLFNTAGQLVLEQAYDDQQIELELSALPRGLYLFTLLTNKGATASGKIAVK
jgi:uncharacterized repeat protein (TIGR01451 family)